MDTLKTKVNAQAVKELEQKFERVMMTLAESEKFLDKLTQYLDSLQVDMVNTMLDLLQKVDELNGHSDGSSTPSRRSKSETTSNGKVIQFPKTGKAVRIPPDKKT